MVDPITPAVVAVAALVGLVIVAFVGLRAWHEWLDLQRLALHGRREIDAPPPATPMAARIELADLRERVRRLEAIAAGVDL